MMTPSLSSPTRAALLRALPAALFLLLALTGCTIPGSTTAAKPGFDAARALRLIAATGDPADEKKHHHFTAEVTFSPDGRHMTMTRHLSRRQPPETVVYDRVGRADDSSAAAAGSAPVAIWPGRGY